ncbi:MAG TPA: LytTR family DNA-binding domain-containing protein [Bacteroidales bacterium]
MKNENIFLRCIAVEPDDTALFALSESLKMIPYIELKNTFSNPFDAFKYLNANDIDLVFASIEMTENLNGIQFVNCMKSKPMVVFISNDERLASEAFNADAIDYLIKPFSFERLLKATNKASIHLAGTAQVESNALVNNIQTQQNLFIKTDYKILKLKLNEILFFEGFNDYVKIHTSDAKPILSHVSLRVLEEKLPPNEFIRVHRSYIISINKIDTIEKKRIIIGKNNIPISLSYQQPFYELIEKKNLCLF